ncbi:hypothetical protein LINPERHAP1_LOCUS7151 [Linum perenne]
MLVESEGLQQRS